MINFVVLFLASFLLSSCLKFREKSEIKSEASVCPRISPNQTDSSFCSKEKCESRLNLSSKRTINTKNKAVYNDL